MSTFTSVDQKQESHSAGLRSTADKNDSNNHPDKTNDIDMLNQCLVDSLADRKHRERSRLCLEQSWPVYRDLLKRLSQLTHVPADTLNNYCRTIGLLILFGLMFPLNLLITFFTLFLSNVLDIIRRQQTTPAPNPNSKRILVSGGMMTKALQLCRSLHRAGHQVILVDSPDNWLTGHRWSNSVERFYIHPAPDKEPEAYITTLMNIVRKEKIEMFIPVTDPYRAHIDAQAKSALAVHGCSTFHMNADEVTSVDDKFTFTEKARSLGLPVPKSFLITSHRQLLDFNFDDERRPFICKGISYDWLERTRCITLPRATRAETIAYINQLPVSNESPYILQEFIQGQEYCTHGTCIDGELTLYTCCRSSAWQLNYEHVEQPAVLEWCTKFVRALNLTGHASFDFIVSNDDGQVYGIECNPRVHSAITAFYNHPSVADAYFRPAPQSPIIPLSSARSTYWLYHEMWRLIRNARSIKKVLAGIRTILQGKEAIWSLNDPLPFFLHYHVHLPYLLFDNLRPNRVRFFQKIDCCIGELT